MAIRYEVRSASLIGLVTEVEKLGGDLESLLGEAGLSLDQLGDHDCFIGLDSVIRVLALAAGRLACPALGMRIAQHQGFFALGLLGKLVAAEPDLGAAFKAVQRYLALHNNAEQWRMQVHSGRAYLQRIEQFYGLPQAQQYRELALATYVRLAMELGGPDARPIRVEISHSRIASVKLYQQYFGCEVLFDREHDCLVYDEKVMRYPVRPIPELAVDQADEYRRARLANLRGSLELQVRSLIAQALGFNQHSLESVAALMDMHPRTLQRRLREQGLGFQPLLQEVKMQLACWHLEASAIDLTLLSHALGYNELAAFSKAFKNHTGVAPSHWRKQNRQLPG
ncbi:AraC family transcriptional regulator [Metapseudomonas resinovorans]|uniref:Putative AraC family transcriptional regulator n=1 Tax=Metapseudomonas resinovorans NBRC 106553 TaxID=1245471 RepID=S6ANQ5_METRE|nr:AraC family transcriptional regulator [Pseudomonas resinovorans]BAN47238.1 putative AraC family transcriptional regulator [Pseudomonas resinovorans NBRC 106553]